MLSLERLLRVRSAYGGRFDADGKRLYVVSDLANVPQVWGTTAGWPELVLAPPDRAQTIYPGPRTGLLAAGCDIGGAEHTQMYLLDGGSVRQAIDDPEQIFRFGGWSPEGDRFAFASNARTNRWFDVYVRDVASGADACLLEDNSTNQAGPISPDGHWCVITRLFSNVHQELWLVSLDGSASPRRLTDGESAGYGSPHWTPDGRSIVCVSDWRRDLAAAASIDVETGSLDYVFEADVEVDDAALTRDGRRIAVALNRDGWTEILVRDLTSGAEHMVEGLPPGTLYEYWQSGLAWSRDGERLAFSWTGSRSAPNVWVHDVEFRETRKVTDVPTAGVDLGTLVEPELTAYPSFDGRQIPALYFAPREPSGSPPPCVVFVHGGPEGQFRPSFQPVVQYLLSAGFAVLAPNVRGSSGYGKHYLSLDDVRLRMDSVADLAHAAHWLRDAGRADPERIAVYGGSYGGFMVLAALTTYPDLWAAGVDLVGIANFVTFLENTGPWRRHLREAEYGSLEHDRDFLEEISPINHVDRIRAPLFVVHGANDPRVPIGEAEQMVRRLRERGRTVEMVRLEDEGHQISKLANKLAVYPAVAQFLGQHLLGK